MQCLHHGQHLRPGDSVIYGRPLATGFDKRQESGYGAFNRGERQRGPVDRGPRIDDRQRSSLEISDDEIDIPPFLR